MNILICGCGALGSNITMNIIDLNHNYTLLDDDRVAQENLATTPYDSYDVGRLKVDALATKIIGEVGTRAINPNFVFTRHKTLARSPLGQLPMIPELIIDTFDNIEARGYTMGTKVSTIHVSIGEHSIGAIEWDSVFQLPTEGYNRGENPVCTNELGRNLILFTSTVASVIINKYLATGVKESAYVNIDSLEVYK